MHVDGFVKAPEICVHVDPIQQAQERVVVHGAHTVSADIIDKSLSG